MSKANKANSLKRVAARGSLIYLFGVAVSKLIGLTINLLITNLFGAIFFGRYSMSLSVIRFFETASMMGLTRGGMYSISKAYSINNIGKQVGTSLQSVCTGLIAGCFFGTILFFSANMLAEGIFEDENLINYLRILAFSIPLEAVMTIEIFLSRAYHTLWPYVLTKNIGAPFSIIALFSGLLVVGVGGNSIYYAHVGSRLFAAILAGFLLFRLLVASGAAANPLKVFRRWSGSDYKALLLYSWPFVFIEMLAFVLTSTDIVMLGILSNAKVVGIYAAAARVAALVLIVLSATNSIFSPLVASLDMEKSEDRIRLTSLFRSLTRWMIILSLPLVSFLWIVPKSVMACFGASFVESGSMVLVVLSVGTFFNLATGGVGVILNMTGNQKKELANTIVIAALNIILNWLMIPKWGGIGAAMATMISTILVNFLRVLQVFFLFRIHPFSPLFISFPLMGCILICYMLNEPPNLVPIDSILGQLAIGGMISFFLLIILSILFSTQREKQIAKEYIETLKSKTINKRN